MDHFSRYPKMGEDSAGSAASSGTWICTEKIHGANFSLVADHAGKVQPAKRSGVLQPDEDFYGAVSSGLVQCLCRCARKLFQTVSSEVGEIQSLQVYGELFGGAYPHADVPPVPGVRAVQSGVWYSPGIHFLAFDLAITSSDGGRVFADFDAAKTWCEAAGLAFVEPLLRGSLSACLARPVEFSSTIASRLGWPQLEGNANLAEGLVVRPARERKRRAGAGGAAFSERGERGIFKRKIASFSEKQYDNPDWRAARGGGHAAGNDKLALCRYEVLACVNAARLHSVISKSGALLDGSNRAANIATLSELKADVVDALRPDERSLLSASPALQHELEKAAKSVIRAHVAEAQKQLAQTALSKPQPQ